MPGIGTLRRYRQLGVVKQAIAAAQCEGLFQICEFNLLGNHVHLIIEAAGAVALARGMQGLAVRLARRLNAVLGRKGKLFAERYHARCLKTPRQVRNALRYVLLNSRHHAAERGEKLARYWIDPFSSAAWFTGWQEAIRVDQPWKKQLLAQAPPTLPATVWLLKTGWQRWGLLSFDEIPGGHETA
jgi:REP element-mobilizing transposase RayT